MTAIPLARLIELQALLIETREKIDYPADPYDIPNCLRSRLSRMTGIIQFYTEEATAGIAVPIAVEEKV